MISEGIHPKVRIALLVVFIFFVSMGTASHLAAAVLALAGVYAVVGRQALIEGLGRLRFLRYFFVSIVVLYFWFTPGERIALGIGPADALWLPTYEGVLEGVLRIAVLVCIVLAVNVLNATTARSELVPAIAGLAAPLRWLRFDPQRLAIRMVLTMEKVANLREPLTTLRRTLPATRRGESLLKRLGVEVARFLHRVNDEPGNGQPGVLLGSLPACPKWQWGLPLLVVALYWIV